jgi:putative ABC transport system permease protein
LVRAAHSDALARSGRVDQDRLAKQASASAGRCIKNPSKHWGRMYVEGMTLVMQLLACISLFMSVVLVFNTLTALITQQTNQIGIIKAIGGRSMTIVKVIAAQIVVAMLAGASG